MAGTIAAVVQNASGAKIEAVRRSKAACGETREAGSATSVGDDEVVVEERSSAGNALQEWRSY